MRSKQQFFHSLFLVIPLAMAIVLALAAIPASAQNMPPTTVREAVDSPTFAPHSAHPASAQATRNSRPPSSSRRVHTPQDGQMYSNGPTDGNHNGWFIGQGQSYVVSDSFTGDGTNIAGFMFAAWVEAGSTPTTVDWAVGTTSFGSDLGSGTADISISPIFCHASGTCGLGVYDVYDATVTGLSLPTNSGATYWLTLTNANDSFGGRDAWDVNSGPSQAYHNLLGAVPSESFTINGGGTGSQCIYDKGSFQIIHDFTAQDGGPDSGVVVDKAGTLYGSASGGDYLHGLLYKLAQSAGDWVLDPLYSFAGGGSGKDPGQVIFGPNETLYGVAGGGIQDCGSDGTSYCGLVYNLRPPTNVCRTAACSWTETTLYQFSGNTDAWGGAVNTFDQGGNLYGTASSGGAYGQGAVYKLTPSQEGWTETVLYSFTGNSDGAQPNGVLVGHDGNLYGTASTGGAGGGVVFQLVPSAAGWTENVIYTFTGDGSAPFALVQDKYGNFYGLSAHQSCFPWKCTCSYFGIVFELSLLSPGNWRLTVLVDNFPGDNCTNVFHDLAIDSTNDLYVAGGEYDGDCGPYSNGYVYDLRGRVYVAFAGPGDTDDFYNLALDQTGNVYGTTGSCGAYGKGTVWKLSGNANVPLHREQPGAYRKGGVCQSLPK